MLMMCVCLLRNTSITNGCSYKFKYYTGINTVLSKKLKCTLKLHRSERSDRQNLVIKYIMLLNDICMK